MALTGTASRFACLPDDDNTDWIAPKSKKGGNKSHPDLKGDSVKKAKANSGKNEAKELQALAFGGPAKKKNNKKKPVKQPSKDSAQFEEWQQKDVEFNEDKFVSELEQAILQSKIDYEEKKDLYSKLEHERSPQKLKQQQQAANKPLTVSLDEFNTLNTKQLEKLKISDPITNGSKQKSPIPDETDYFEKLDAETRKAVTREQLLESYRLNQKTFSSDGALMEHFKSSIEEKNVEIAKLQSDNSTLKDDLSNVKKRYKKLREILDQCEMRDKAEIIVENEKLKVVRDELSGEVTRLSKSDFDLEKASRGIVFLDGMQNIGQNQGLSKREQQQVLREILQIVEGTTPIDVTRAGSTSMEREVLDTSKMFFILFGVFEAEEQLLNQDFEEEGFENDFEVIPDEKFKMTSLEHNNNNNNVEMQKDLNERRDSRTSQMSMDTTSSICSDRSCSNTSSEKSPENSKPAQNQKTSQKLTRRKDEFTCTKKLNSSNNNTTTTTKNNKVVVKSNESDLSSSTSSVQDDFDYWYSADDSFQGLKENKLARLMTEAENSPIPHYQMLWGMKDVDLKFNPEALEIIANQAMSQQAGRDGVATILEKLFLTIKFDILGTDIVAVEITEDFVLGKSSPIYHHASKRRTCTVNRNQHRHNSHQGLYSILEEGSSSPLSDYDQGILDQIEM